MPHARRTPAKHENTSGVPVRVPAAPGAKRGETVTKPVSFRVARLRKLLKTKNFTEYRYGHPCRDRLDEVSIFYLRSSTNQSIIVHTLETNILPSLCFGKYRTPFALSLSKGESSRPCFDGLSTNGFTWRRVCLLYYGLLSKTMASGTRSVWTALFFRIRLP